MDSPTKNPRSLAAKTSWVALSLAIGCAGVFLIGLVIDQVSPFDRHGRQGVLSGVVPRTVLYVLWAGEALAVVIGIGSFLLIRRADITSKAVFGIVARSLCGIAVGLVGTIFLWLIVGHIVIGF